MMSSLSNTMCSGARQVGHTSNTYSVSHKTTLLRLFNLYSAGIDFRRQNLTSKVDPRAVKVGLSIFIMAVDQHNRYPDEAERAN